MGTAEIAPKKAYVSLRRSKQFALIQPSTRTRVDLGLILKSAKAAGKLEQSGSFNTMVSHRRQGRQGLAEAGLFGSSTDVGRVHEPAFWNWPPGR